MTDDANLYSLTHLMGLLLWNTWQNLVATGKACHRHTRFSGTTGEVFYFTCDLL